MAETCIKICPECNKEFTSKYGITICCSRSCSNKYQAKLRKTNIDKETGLPLSKLYSSNSVKARYANGTYDSEEYKEKLRNLQNWKKMFTADAIAKQKLHKEKQFIPDEFGITPSQRRVEKMMQTKYKNGTLIPLEQKPEFQRYIFLARYFTELNDLTKLENYNKRGRAGTNGAYHLDHIYTIFDGFSNNVPPEIIGNINNLRFIPWEENVSKNFNSCITLDTLFETTGFEYTEYYPENYIEIKRSKNSAEKMNSIRMQCEYCDKIISSGNYSRWHGEKCKSKQSVTDLLK